MNEQCVFANTPEAVSRARRYVTGQLLDVPRETVDAIAIMVSELATNCVRHADTDFTVGVEHTPRQIRVEVTDGGNGMPTVRSPGSNEPTGRGLRIVRELADSFGVRELGSSPGKTVWFVLDLEQSTPRRTARRSPAHG